VAHFKLYFKTSGLLRPLHTTSSMWLLLGVVAGLMLEPVALAGIAHLCLESHLAGARQRNHPYSLRRTQATRLLLAQAQRKQEA
jgi:hypothetical protein